MPARPEPFANYTVPFHLGGRPDGMYYILWRYRGEGGTERAGGDHELHLDQTPPGLDVTYRGAGGSAPPALFLGADAEVSVVAGDEGVGVGRLQWRLNGGAFSEVTGPIVVGAVAPRPGPYILEVKATDLLGHARTWIGCFVRSGSRAAWERAREEQERIEETRWRLRGAVASIDRAQGLVTIGVRYGNAPSVVRSGAPNPAIGTTARLFRADGVDVPVEVTPAQPHPPTVSLGPGAAHEVSLRVKARDGVLAPGSYVLVILLNEEPMDVHEFSLP